VGIHARARYGGGLDVSAIRLIATTRDAIASAGKIVAHQASEMSAYCSAIWSPQSGEGGCGP
jgi:hypothetical protein